MTASPSLLDVVGRPRFLGGVSFSVRYALWVLVMACGGSVSCGTLWNRDAGVVPMSPREEGVSFRGPGSSRVDRKAVKPIYFAPGRWELEPGHEPVLAALAATLGREKHAILAGWGDRNAAAEEYSRVLGEARAQAVRQRLIRLGVGPTQLQTVAFGENPGDASGDGPASCVEIGLVR